MIIKESAPKEFLYIDNCMQFTFDPSILRVFEPSWSRATLVFQHVRTPTDRLDEFCCLWVWQRAAVPINGHPVRCIETCSNNSNYEWHYSKQQVQ